MKSAKRIIVSLVMIVAVASVAVYATRAYFSDTETSEGNTIRAGEIDLKVSAYLTSPTNQNETWGTDNLTGEPLFNFVDLKPGDVGGGYFDLVVTSNQAYACVNAEVTATPENGITDPEEEFGDTTSDEGELQKYLKVWFWNDADFNGEVTPFTDEFDSIVGPVDLSSTNGTDGWETLTDPTGGVFGTLGMTPATPYYLGMKYCMGTLIVDPVAETATCSGEGDQNDAQTDGVEAKLAFYAVQTRNNSEFTCESMNGPEEGSLIFVLDENASGDNVAYNLENQVNGWPYVEWDEITGDEITFNFYNPTGIAQSFYFDYQVDGESGSSVGGVTGETPSSGRLAGIPWTDFYNFVVLGPGETESVTVSGTNEIRVRLRLGPERDYDFDWITFIAN